VKGAQSADVCAPQQNHVLRRNDVSASPRKRWGARSVARDAPSAPHAPGDDERTSAYRLETRKSRLVWKSLMRSTGTLGQRWLRRKARQDWTVHPLGPGIDLVTFWLDQRIGGGGTGVCMALFCHGYEVLRFDCFGRGGHYHLTPLTLWPVSRRRLDFRTDTVEGQIEEALFEICQNLDFYLQINPRRCVRSIRVDQEARVRACESARAQLHGYLDRVAVLRPLRVLQLVAAAAVALFGLNAAVASSDAFSSFVQEGSPPTGFVICDTDYELYDDDAA
jgi:hypothetical protein